MPNKELAQAIQKATGLSTDSSGNEIIFYDEIEWKRGNGPALKAKILPILQDKFGVDATFIFNDYYPEEPNERSAEKASIILPKM